MVDFSFGGNRRSIGQRKSSVGSNHELERPCEFGGLSVRRCSQVKSRAFSWFQHEYCFALSKYLTSSATSQVCVAGSEIPTPSTFNINSIISMDAMVFVEKPFLS
eukprot:scaffold15507_cov74-Cyclotella_meneghiniana.AAC.7